MYYTVVKNARVNVNSHPTLLLAVRACAAPHWCVFRLSDFATHADIIDDNTMSYYCGMQDFMFAEYDERTTDKNGEGLCE